MATQTVSGTKTITILETESKNDDPPTPTLKLRSPKQEKKIQWAENTVDNEGMGKKSSKCCCIYKKPKMFGESSSEDETSDEDDCCKAPKDYHKKSHKQKHDDDHCNC